MLGTKDRHKFAMKEDPIDFRPGTSQNSNRVRESGEPDLKIENEDDLIIPQEGDQPANKTKIDPRRQKLMESDSEDEGLDQLLASNLEDIHNPLKVILQRQFFELVVRSAYVRF